MNRLYALVGGRCTFFALVFTAAGIWLALRGQLSANYVALVGAIQALVVSRALGDDYHQRACNGKQ